MSDDEKNPVNPVDEGEKGDTGDKRDKKTEPSNNKKKDKNKNGGDESEEETSDDEMSYEEWKAWRKIRRSKGRKRLVPELSLTLVMTPPIPREEPHALQTRAAHQS